MTRSAFTDGILLAHAWPVAMKSHNQARGGTGAINKAAWGTKASPMMTTSAIATMAVSVYYKANS